MAELPARGLSREQAAAYVGLSETCFDDEVAAGRYPGPLRCGKKDRRCVWDRKALDEAMDRRSGLVKDDPGVEYRHGGWGDEFEGALRRPAAQ